MPAVIHTNGTPELEEWAALYALGAMDAAEREEYSSHLAGCVLCSQLVEQFALTIQRISVTSMASRVHEAREQFRARWRAQISSSGGSDASVLLNANGVVILRPAAAEWQPGALPGIEAKPLFVDHQRKYSTSLIRMRAGTHYPAHRHVDVEEVYLLIGELHVEGHTMRPGDYCRAEPGSVHEGSYTANGCVFLLCASQADELLV